MAIHTIDTRTICPDVDYRYVVSVTSDSYEVKYEESGPGANPIRMGFGSAEEMRAVAFAMLDLTGGR